MRHRRMLRYLRRIGRACESCNKSATKVASKLRRGTLPDNWGWVAVHNLAEDHPFVCLKPNTPIHTATRAAFDW